MFTAVLFTIFKTWKLPQCPLADKWTRKMWYRYTVKYSAARGMNEIFPFATMWN